MEDEIIKDETPEIEPEDDLTPDATYFGDPVFEVDAEDFYKNIQQNRNRMRFKPDSKVSKFMRSTNYRKPFVMSYTDGNKNKQYKKVK